jgi:hypothetical protein
MRLARVTRGLRLAEVVRHREDVIEDVEDVEDVEDLEAELGLERCVTLRFL